MDLLILSSSQKASYIFEAGGHGTGSTTSLVKTMTTNGHTYTFTYDDIGNITEVKDNDGSTTKTNKYHYNELNELVREDNEVINKTIVYFYDLGGNILSKKNILIQQVHLVQLQKQ